MQRTELGEKISAYGLIDDLREQVAKRRKSQKRPARDTVWRAFNTKEESALLALIQRVAAIIVNAHEAQFTDVEPVTSDRETAVAA